MINNSDPLGSTNWFQGNSAVFPSYEGEPGAYIAANFNNTTSGGTISNWLLTPALDLRNGTELRFWTRAPQGKYPDRLQVRMSTAGQSMDVGDTAQSVGDFTEVLLTVNESLAPGGYPEEWTEFVVMVSGLNGPTGGRLAFRYFVTGAGPGLNSDYIGIDTVAVQSPATPTQFWGDVDCDGGVAIGDALKVARWLLGLSVSQEEGCPEIGTEVEVAQPPLLVSPHFPGRMPVQVVDGIIGGA